MLDQLLFAVLDTPVVLVLSEASGFLARLDLFASLCSPAVADLTAVVSFLAGASWFVLLEL